MPVAATHTCPVSVLQAANPGRRPADEVHHEDLLVSNAVQSGRRPLPTRGGGRVASLCGHKVPTVSPQSHHVACLPCCSTVACGGGLSLVALLLAGSLPPPPFKHSSFISPRYRLFVWSAALLQSLGSWFEVLNALVVKRLPEASEVGVLPAAWALWSCCSPPALPRRCTPHLPT